MEYFIYNKLSKLGRHKTSSDMLDVSSLSSTFFENLSASDTVELHGGDGTINWFINNCHEFPKLIINPSGTGNDLARSLTSDFQKIPVFEVNGIRFINGFDVGFGAMVCQLVNANLPKTKLSYVKSVYRSLIRLQRFEAEIIIDGERYFTSDNFIIAVQNTEYFGGGMKVAPNLDPTDNKLAVYSIGNASKLVIALIFPSIFFGKHAWFKRYVKVYSGSQINVKLKEKYVAETDGDLIGSYDSFSFEQCGYIQIKKQ
ncbi:diacylglycerol kinase family protein [Mollicutes bacterium LVI A0039]|nr:diacylglycerol kinase family protein [Mollicutes bacterium LVI A0039]